MFRTHFWTTMGTLIYYHTWTLMYLDAACLRCTLKLRDVGLEGIKRISVCRLLILTMGPTILSGLLWNLSILKN